MLKKISVFVIALTMIFCLNGCGNSDLEEKGDYLSGNLWEATDGTLLDLNSDGTYKFYKSSSDKTNNYYTGNFEVLNNEDAINYLINEYEIDEESQRSAMTRFGVSDEFYYVLVLNNKECIIDGKNTLEEENKIEYFGYYDPNDEQLNFTSLNTTAHIDFYKK